MQWLNKIVDELVVQHPSGRVVVSSGVSPSGKYHMGTLREILTAEAIARELRFRGREAQHIHVVDDLDVFRKVPAGIPESYKDYLGMPLCDVPSPENPSQTYADYYLSDLLSAAEDLKLDMEIVRAHEKYRSGFFTDAIELALENVDVIKTALTEISGRALDDAWSPVQVVEGGYLKNRRFVSLNKEQKMLTYINSNDEASEISYADGKVKLNWRIDWPARWWKLGVNAEPFGRDHATKGGSYDTGRRIVKDVYASEAPVPVPYNFINRTGDTKKMSKSAGDTITASGLLTLLPPEIVWYFIIRYAPEKQLFFDEGPTLMRLVDEFAELAAKADRDSDEEQLLRLCTGGLSTKTVSRIPFSHLVASYQAALKDVNITLDVMRRTEHKATVDEDADIIKHELAYIDAWLENSAPEDVKFSLREHIDASVFNEQQKQFLIGLADKLEDAPADADGEWFHKAIYGFKDTTGMSPKDLFVTLYQALIGKDSGPRAGWFLSLLPREWLVKRLKLDV